MSPPPAFDLQRFVQAQDPIYDQVQAELARGLKTSHWMWFVFPQLRGLGRSATAQLYGIASAAEALAYGQHALLGARLRECTALALAVPGKTAHHIFGSPDDLKLRSCLTLFARALPDELLFDLALNRFFDGQADASTLSLLDRDGSA